MDHHHHKKTIATTISAAAGQGQIIVAKEANGRIPSSYELNEAGLNNLTETINPSSSHAAAAADSFNKSIAIATII